MNDPYEWTLQGRSSYDFPKGGDMHRVLSGTNESGCGSKREPVSSLPVKPIAHAIARAEYENLRPPATQSRPKTTVVPIGRTALSQVYHEMVNQ
jgi:hypothetical protein